MTPENSRAKNLVMPLATAAHDKWMATVQRLRIAEGSDTDEVIRIRLVEEREAFRDKLALEHVMTLLCREE